MTRRRDATRVIHDILILARVGITKTQVMYRANLSFPLVERYVSFLLSHGHLRLSMDHQGVQRYTLTRKGERFLRFLKEVQRELIGFFSNTSASSLTTPVIADRSISNIDLEEIKRK